MIWDDCKTILRRPFTYNMHFHCSFIVYFENATTRPQDVPQTPLRRPQTPQDAPKTPQDAPKTPQDAPRRPRTPPRRPQDAPKTPQRRPKRAQDASNTPLYTLITPSTCVYKTLQNCSQTLNNGILGMLERPWGLWGALRGRLRRS